MWKPGHVSRPIPEGYLESLAADDNHLADRNLAAYYDAIRRVTRGPLWSRQRWSDIWKLHTGAYDSLVEAYVKAHPEDFSHPPEDLRKLFTIDDSAVILSGQ